MPPRKKTADEPAAEKPARRPRSTQKFARNLYGSPLGLRLAGGDRIELRPRGQRGDLAPITKDQQGDAKMLLNIGVTVEVISEAEARKIIEAQNTNQQAFHPTAAILRDALGRPYENPEVRVEADPQAQGETVALLKDGQIVTQRVPGKGQQMVRNPSSVGPRIATGIPGGDDEFAGLLEADDAAKNGTSLEDVLGGYTFER